MDDKHPEQPSKELSALDQRADELPVSKTEREPTDVDHEHLLAALQRRNTQLQTAVQVSQSASTILDPQLLADQAVNLIQESFGFYYVGLFLKDELG